MGGVAALARAAGFRVTGSDSAVYPPMSTQLKELGIEIHHGFDAAQLAFGRIEHRRTADAFVILHHD